MIGKDAIEIGAWPVGDTRIVKLRVERFGRGFVIDVRVWEKKHGNLVRSRNGLRAAATHLPKLAIYINAALRKAQQLGIVEEDRRRKRD